MGRHHNSETITLATDDTSPKRNFSDYAGGRVYIPALSSITSITFYDAPKFDGTYVAAYDDTLTTPLELKLTGLQAGRSYTMPPQIFAAGGIQMRSNTAGDVIVSLKD